MIATPAGSHQRRSGRQTAPHRAGAGSTGIRVSSSIDCLGTQTTLRSRMVGKIRYRCCRSSPAILITGPVVVGANGRVWPKAADGRRVRRLVFSLTPIRVRLPGEWHHLVKTATPAAAHPRHSWIQRKLSTALSASNYQYRP